MSFILLTSITICLFATGGSLYLLWRLGDWHGIVTLTNNRPNLLLDHEAKPLKMRISTIGESPRFRCESD